MRYLVKAKLKAGRGPDLLKAMASGELGRGSVAGDEYARCLREARWMDDGTARWVEVCFCDVPLEEERPYWEEYFEILGIEDAHNRANCRDVNGSQRWACTDCDCTRRLEQRLATKGTSFLRVLEAGGVSSPGTAGIPAGHCIRPSHSTE